MWRAVDAAPLCFQQLNADYGSRFGPDVDVVGEGSPVLLIVNRSWRTELVTGSFLGILVSMSFGTDRDVI